MAIDTRDKRGSTIGLGLVLVLPLANSGVDQGDRQQTAHIYRGILAAAPVVPTTAGKLVIINGQMVRLDVGIDKIVTINGRIIRDQGAESSIPVFMSSYRRRRIMNVS